MTGWNKVKNVRTWQQMGEGEQGDTIRLLEIDMRSIQTIAKRTRAWGKERMTNKACGVVIL